MKTVVVQHRGSFGDKTVSYSAIPARELFKDLNIEKQLSEESDMTLLFTCLDGFAAPISARRLLNDDPKQSIAYLAIEPSDHFWPPVKPETSNATAGPFFLVWENPEKSKIGPEEWPYQLTRFDVQLSARKMYPKTAPAEHISESSTIGRGYKAFLKNCFACHTVNLEGAAQMGPDLVFPLSPTEYMKPGQIEKLVRNPQSLRHWPQSRMASFSRDVLSDADLKAIVSYLSHMAEKRKSEQKKEKGKST